jgi:hypothetical protein
VTSPAARTERFRPGSTMFPEFMMGLRSDRGERAAWQ